MTRNFECVEDILLEMFEMVRAPERITVSDAAAQYRKVYSPGAPSGPWDNDLTPYMREPMDMFPSREIKGLIFVGPAQSGKTDALILNTVGYCAKVDPMDMLVYSPTQKAARDFSIRRIDRLHTHSPEIGKMLASLSPLMEENFMTAMRVRLAERRGREMLERKLAAFRASKATSKADV